MFAFLFIIFALSYIIFWIFDYSKHDWTGYAPPGVVLSFTLGGLLVAQIAMYSDASTLEAQLAVIDKKVEILQLQADDIVDRIKSEASFYVAYEDSVFSRISSKNVQTLLIVYPQLRAVEGVVASINAINALYTKIYQMRLDEQDIRAKLIFYKNFQLYAVPVNFNE